MVIAATGRLDHNTADDFRRDLSAAIANAGGAVILDLDGLSYISSAGLRAIIATSKALRKRRVQIGLCSLRDSVKKVMEVTGFSEIIPIHPTRRAAVAALSPPRPAMQAKPARQGEALEGEVVAALGQPEQSIPKEAVL